MALHPKVLSRKLSPNNEAALTQPEIKQLIKTLAAWRAILSQSEAVELLELGGLHYASFEEQEWEAPPLDRLEKNIQLGANNLTLMPGSWQKSNNNLPASLTSFVGREESVTRLCQMLGRGGVRLISLVGMGGAGKTRLVLEVAKRTIEQFEHGVWFVPLAGVSDPALLITTIVLTLELELKESRSASILDQLKSYLRPKQLLLILDNFEQLLEGAPQVSELLEAAAGLKILVSSRSVLHLYGEYAFKVIPLKLPELGKSSVDATFSQTEAVQLFVERAQAANLDFEITPDNSLTVAKICVQLEGLPLAIELAAARTSTLGLSLLLEQLSRARLPILTEGARNLPVRHQTLQNTLEWSYNLLDTNEREWFLSLGIFRGGWTIEAAHASCAPAGYDEIKTLDKLNALLEKNLIVREQPFRFNMLETVREFALHLLTLKKEYISLQERHALFYLQLATQAAAALQGPEQTQWLTILVTELNNFRAALNWASGLPTETSNANELPTEEQEVKRLTLGLELATALSDFWNMRGYWSEGYDYLEHLLTLSSSLEIRVAIRVKALNAISQLAILQGNYKLASVFAQESLTMSVALANQSEIATAQTVLGEVALNQGDYALAQTQLQTSLVVFRQLENPVGIANILSKLGLTFRYLGDFKVAQKYLLNKSGQLILSPRSPQV